MPKIYLGLMSGTSIDAIDAAMFDFSISPPRLISAVSTNITSEERELIGAINSNKPCLPAELFNLDAVLGNRFAEAALSVIAKSGLNFSDVLAIGSHGQTVFHAPENVPPFTAQLADPSVIATRTKLPVVADFRRNDIAAGGQGAPLAPLFHQKFFSAPDHSNCVLNLGGIANLTVLKSQTSTFIQNSTIGFDIGPANTLMDSWFRLHHKDTSLGFDRNGEWAKTGNLLPKILNKLVSDPYFAKSPPKSTGTEYFNLAWLERYLENKNYLAQDVQRTLLELNLTTIYNAVTVHAPRARNIYLCGGGVNNKFQLKRMQHEFGDINILPIDKLGIPAKWLECACFAWLAKMRLEQRQLNTMSITGSKHPVSLGAIYHP